jgi:hypothetical protein
MDFSLVPIVIDKYKIKEHELDLAALHVYHLAMQFGLEELYRYLDLKGQIDRITYVVFEARGRKEDTALEMEFRRICSGENSLKLQLPFEVIIADKKSNSEGLQFADLVARPIGLSVLHPNQPNRAVKVLEEKFFQSSVIGNLVKFP